MELILGVALAVAVAVIALEGVLLYTLLRQHGLMLIGQDELRRRLAGIEQTIASLGQSSAPAPQPALEPLSIGTPAPAFALRDLDGRERSLSEFGGRPLVVLFFNPQCGFCAQMAPELGHLGAEAVPLLLVSRGSAEEHRRLAAEHAWRCEVVLEPGWEVATAYGTRATPTGYLVDSQGRIASALTVGAPALLALIEGEAASGNGDPLEAQRDKQGTVADRARAAGLPVRDIGESRINRNGLSAGTKAPEFELPDLSGAAHSLSSLRGKRVLLVFSDPNCGPCEQLTPSLARLHEHHRTNGVEVIMVSKGDVEANRQKAREHDVSFPVLLQRGSEVAKQYGSFATPVGYLIDERGTLSTDLTIGTDAILGLVS
jgi:peroxiredoxin